MRCPDRIWRQRARLARGPAFCAATPGALAGLAAIVAGLGLAAPVALAVDQFDLAAGYEGISEQAAQLPGLGDSQLDLSVLHGLWQRQIQDGRLLYTVGATGEAGAAATAGARFGTLTLKPQIKAEFSRQIHHLEMIGSLGYDQSGLARRPLGEQWDNVFLTPAQRQRYAYGGISSDHYAEMAPRLNMSLYLFTGYLNQGLISKSYGGGGYLEYQWSDELRLRLGGIDQLFFFDQASIRSQGPEVSVVYQLTPSGDLEAKAGLITVSDNTGDSQGLTGKAVWREERGDLGWRLSWEKGVVSRATTSGLSTSNTYSLTTHGQIDRLNGLELSAEERQEDWVKGFEGTTPADSLKAELRYVHSFGGASWWLPGRAAWNTVAAYGTEQLHTKAAAQGTRQILRFSVERVL